MAPASILSYTVYTVQTGQVPEIPLPQPPEYWNYRRASPHLAFFIPGPNPNLRVTSRHPKRKCPDRLISSFVLPVLGLPGKPAPSPSQGSSPLLWPSQSPSSQQLTVREGGMQTSIAKVAREQKHGRERALDSSRPSASSIFSLPATPADRQFL